MCLPQRTCPLLKPTSSNCLSALRLANRPATPTGSRLIKGILMNESGLPLPCSSRDRLWRKVRSMNGSTRRRNGNSDKRRSPMREKTWERNTSGMGSHAHRRKEENRKRVEEIISQLLRQQQTINFNSASKAAGDTKAYLYGQSDCLERIEPMRQQA